MTSTASTSNSSRGDSRGSGAVLARGCSRSSIERTEGTHRCLESIMRNKLDRPKHARSAVVSADFELDPSPWRPLPVLLTGSFLSFLDFFVVNIALPSIRVDLRASAADLQLIVAAYGLALRNSSITAGLPR